MKKIPRVKPNIDTEVQAAYLAVLETHGTTETILAQSLGYKNFHAMRTSSRYRRQEIQKTVISLTKLFAKDGTEIPNTNT